MNTNNYLTDGHLEGTGLSKKKKEKRNKKMRRKTERKGTWVNNNKKRE